MKTVKNVSQLEPKMFKYIFCEMFPAPPLSHYQDCHYYSHSTNLDVGVGPRCSPVNTMALFIFNQDHNQNMFISYYVLLRRHLAVMDTTQICVYLVYGACIMGGGRCGWSGEVEVDKRIRQLKLIDCTNMGKFVLSIEVQFYRLINIYFLGK